MTDVARLGDSLKWQIHEFVRIAKHAASAPDRYGAILEGIWALWRGLADRVGCPVSDQRLRELLAADLDLNAQGLVHWLGRSGQ